MTSAFAILAAVCFAATAMVFFADLLQERRDVSRLCRLGMWVSTGVAIAVLAAAILESGVGVLATLRGSLVLMPVLLGVEFLVLRKSYPVRVVGAMVAPAAFLFLTALLLHDHPGAVAAAPEVSGALLVAHVLLVVMGLGAFALAAFLSLAYLVQERQIRRRRFGTLFRRLPSLDVLHGASMRLVTVGFPLYTVAIIFGAIWAYRRDVLGVDARILFAAGAWLVFGFVLHMRLTSGLRGRSAAVLTMSGFLAAVVVLGFYAAA